MKDVICKGISLVRECSETRWWGGLGKMEGGTKSFESSKGGDQKVFDQQGGGAQKVLTKFTHNYRKISKFSSRYARIYSYITKVSCMITWPYFSQFLEHFLQNFTQIMHTYWTITKGFLNRSTCD